MDQRVLNILATTAAEFHALGDDKNSEKVMGAVGWLVDAHGMLQDAFDQANAVYNSFCDLPITEIPDAGRPGEVEECFAAMNEGSKELMAGASLLMECIELLRDYWAERMQTDSDTFEECKS